MSALVVILVVVAGVVLGLTATQLPAIAVLIVCSAAFLAMLMLAYKGLLMQGVQSLERRASLTAHPDTPWLQREEAGGPEALGLARLLFYAGCLLVGQLTLRPLFAFTLSDLLILGSLGAVLLAGSRSRSLWSVRLSDGVVWGTLLFSVGALLSTFRSDAPVQSVLILLRFLYLTTVWFWLGSVLLRTRRHQAIAIFCWVTSAGLSGFGAVIQLMLGDVLPGTSPSWGRMTGFTQHVNDLGGLTGIAFVPALALAMQPHGAGWQRLLSWLALGGVTIGLLLSGSLGGLSAAIAAFAAWLVLGHVRWRMVLVAMTVCVLGVGVMQVQGSSGGTTPVSRLSDVSQRGTDRGTFWSRVDVYDQAWQQIKTDPLIGVGLDDQTITTRAGGFVHNLMLSAWTSAGVLGFIGIVLVVVSAARPALTSPGSGRIDSLSDALLAAFAGFLVFSLGAPILLQRFAWFPAAMLVAAWPIVQSTKHRFVSERRRSGLEGSSFKEVSRAAVLSATPD